MKKIEDFKDYNNRALTEMRKGEFNLETVYGVKMTWDDFVEFERWDEFPERAYDPPYTAEIEFKYKEKIYFLDCMTDTETHIRHLIWYEVVKNGDKEDIIEFARFDNFLEAVNAPFFDGKSFRERISEFLFAY